jgi:sirohydrochlorin cobaltochelatase
MVQQAEAGHPPVPREECCLLVVGRGTNDPDANSEVAKLTRLVWEGLGFGFATTAYVGVTKPLLADTLPLVESLPYRRVIVLPVFLFTGVLLKRIYSQMEAHQATSAKEYIYTSSFGSDELLLQAVDERIAEVEFGSPNMNCQLCKYRTQMIGFEDEVGKEQTGHHLNVKGILFEEEQKIGANKGLLPQLKNLLGI